MPRSRVHSRSGATTMTLMARMFQRSGMGPKPAAPLACDRGPRGAAHRHTKSWCEAQCQGTYQDAERRSFFHILADTADEAAPANRARGGARACKTTTREELHHSLPLPPPPPPPPPPPEEEALLVYPPTRTQTLLGAFFSRRSPVCKVCVHVLVAVQGNGACLDAWLVVEEVQVFQSGDVRERIVERLHLAPEQSMRVGQLRGWTGDE